MPMDNCMVLKSKSEAYDNLSSAKGTVSRCEAPVEFIGIADGEAQHPVPEVVESRALRDTPISRHDAVKTFSLLSPLGC